MDQFSQTNNLQQAIDEVANKENNNEAENTPEGQFGIPPMPPMEGEGVPAAPFGGAGAPAGDAPSVGAAPAAEPEKQAPSAEQILTSEMPAAPVAPTVEAASTVTPEVSGDLASIRESVVKDLLPLLDKVESSPEEKFEIYKDAMKTMHDAKTIEGAYKVATQIADEGKRADALLGLMKTIDNA